jgi:hypothetical protein
LSSDHATRSDGPRTHRQSGATRLSVERRRPLDTSIAQFEEGTMRRILGMLLLGVVAVGSHSSRAHAQVNFIGEAYVCFDDLLSPCNPDPNILGGFGGSWARINPLPQLEFQGFTYNVTTSATTGDVAINVGNARFYDGSFTGRFYLAMTFFTAPVSTSTLVFGGNATTSGNQLSIDFDPNVKAGVYGAAALPFWGELNDFVLTRGATTATTLSGRLSVRPLTTVVPEPSTYLLLGAGIAAMAILTRRRRMV